MSNAGSPLRTSNLLYQQPSSPRRSIEIFLRKSHPHDMGLTFPPQSDSCSRVHVKLETSTINESVLEAVVARAYICLRNKGNLCITLPKYQGTRTAGENQEIHINESVLHPHEVALLCKLAGFIPIQIDQNEEDYVITCSKV
ncbi:hypothetical protein GpartN1_g2369.t1 [Galdieria partita]|uniref:Uncharacterized protein n=1 Tax=Galdieria partita TaxID=83374 RepID=A0A9C7PTL0_9RHOD|nr:hypothetical protein GpartN1_g2369.t1 [Galdieria partita]